MPLGIWELESLMIVTFLLTDIAESIPFLINKQLYQSHQWFQLSKVSPKGTQERRMSVTFSPALNPKIRQGLFQWVGTFIRMYMLIMKEPQRSPYK